MNEDFQARLARLEAKNGTTSSASEASDTPNTSPQTRARSGRRGIFGMVLAGIACLIILPAGAVFATVYLPQIKEVTEKIRGTADHAAAFVEVVREMDGDGSDEQRSASRELDGILFRMSTGTMSATEEAFWKSEEGNARLDLLEKQASQVDYDKLMDANKRFLGVD